MPATPSVNPMLLSDKEFEKYRYIMDQQADTAAWSILNFLDHGQVYGILGRIQQNTDLVDFNEIKNLSYTPKGGNQENIDFLIKFCVGKVNDYFNDLRFFQWTPEEKECLRKAAIFFNSHMTECTMALALRSLLKQYAAFKSTNVLTYTKLLPKYPYRRIISTMQFVLDVMEQNAFEPEGYGIRSIQKLRLVHALIRNRIELNTLLKTPGLMWNDDWGKPINQQDMIFAVHTFSIEVIHGMIASGEYVSPEEAQNYYYAWHLIGRALGVKDELNPSDYNIGVKVQNRIYQKNLPKTTRMALLWQNHWCSLWLKYYPWPNAKAFMA